MFVCGICYDISMQIMSLFKTPNIDKLLGAAEYIQCEYLDLNKLNLIYLNCTIREGYSLILLLFQSDYDQIVNCLSH